MKMDLQNRSDAYIGLSKTFEKVKTEVEMLNEARRRKESEIRNLQESHGQMVEDNSRQLSILQHNELEF
jgi:hypothetical protein